MSKSQASKLTAIALRNVLAGGFVVGIAGWQGSDVAFAQEVVSQELLAIQFVDQPSDSQKPQAPVALAPEIVPTAAAGSQEILRAKALTIPNTSVKDIGTSQIPADSTQGRLPEPIPLPFGPDRSEGWSYSSKQWIAPVFCHQPTYYEDIMLESHGHERCPRLQPILSGTRFYTGIFLTPYFYYLNGPLDDVASVGRYRPGTAAPALRQRPTYDPYAIGTQVLSTGTGVSLIRP